MEELGSKQRERIIGLFDGELCWWGDVYRDDLPRRFFSYEMRRRLDLVTELLRGEIARRDRPQLLECGCGPGELLQRLTDAPCTLTGLDLNPRYLELAAAKAPAATLRDGDIEDLPFAASSFDIVCAVGVLLYLPRGEQAMAEMARVTKDGGLILISVPNQLMLHLLCDPYYLWRGLRRLFGAAAEDRGKDPVASQIRRYSLRELHRIGRLAGLEPERVASTSFGPGRVWRRELLPPQLSMRVSEGLRRLSSRRLFTPLNHFGNHLIVTLRKGGSGD